MKLRGVGTIAVAMTALAVAATTGCGGRALESPATGTGGSAGTSTGGSAGTSTGGSAGTSTGGSAGTSTGGTSSGGSAGTGGARDGGVMPDSGTPDASPPPGQHILFEVSNENMAWAPTLDGVFITADGSVYSYDYYQGDAGGQPPAVVYPATEQQLRSRYGAHPKKIASVPLGELYAHFAEVEPAASGVLLRQYLCADAGTRTSVGYLYDPSTARYTRVILGMDGDQAMVNLAPPAADLVKWLAQYAQSSPPGCTFQGQQCTGATCGSPAPSCPQGQVPSVVNGCWSKCVVATQCLSVDSCSQCGGMVCATGKDGSKHCLMSYCQSADACSCSSAPPCAGGSAYCTSTSVLRVRCN